MSTIETDHLLLQQIQEEIGRRAECTTKLKSIFQRYNRLLETNLCAEGYIMIDRYTTRYDYDVFISYNAEKLNIKTTYLLEDDVRQFESARELLTFIKQYKRPQIPYSQLKFAYMKFTSDTKLIASISEDGQVNEPPQIGREDQQQPQRQILSAVNEADEEMIFAPSTCGSSVIQKTHFKSKFSEAVEKMKRQSYQ